jgi:3-phenylpropionate/trans-cinnamate dioxygenase ferredoxin reductase component
LAERVVIAGGSHAGIGAADWLRRVGFEGEIVVVTEELFRPYQRPPLSKNAELPDDPAQGIGLRKPEFYTGQDIALRLGIRVASIERHARRVRLADGSDLDYAHLVLATGAQARQLPESLITGQAPMAMRRYDDAMALRRRLASARSLTIVGGGLIGLEVAALACALGRKVTVIEAGPRLLGRVVPPMIADMIKAFHASQGVDIRLNAGLVKLSGGPNFYEAVLASGELVRSDLALVAIGTEPRIELAREAGLALDNGIVVSASGQTSDDHIWSIGDCCNWQVDDASGRRMRFEGIQPATEQARIAAHAIAGKTCAVLPVPRFWSHQGALRLQMAGIASERARYVPFGAGSDETMCVLAVEGGIVSACYALNAQDEFRAAARLVETRTAFAEGQMPGLLAAS